MKMLRLGILTGVAFLATQNLVLAASNDPTAVLQKALFEEEANHNLAAAIEAYQSVITQFEKERKLAATAVFRLGECYRKQGNTNDAVAQYQRVLQEFSDQPNLVALSRQNLAALGNFAAAPTVAAGTSGPAIGLGSAPATAGEEEEVRRIQAMIKDSPDLINARNNGKSPLHSAAMADRLVVATFLLKNGAEVNSKDQEGLTPLVWAAVEGHKAMIELLLDHQADVQATANNGYTALHYAAMKGYRSLLEVLLAHKAQVNAKTVDGITALHLAAANGFKAIAEVLLSSGAEVNAMASNIPNPVGHPSFNGTPLHIAAARGDQAMAELLLAKKADPNAKRDAGWTPLHEAAIFGRESLAALLIGRGAEVNGTVKSGWTPLAFSVQKEFPAVAKVLLAAKADPNIPFDPSGNGKYERAPLFLAVLNKDSQSVELLLKNGANPNVPDESSGHRTPLFAAAQELKADIVSLLLAAKADPNIVDSQGWSPLHWAVGQPTVIENLLAAKAEVNATNKMGETPLHCAAGCGLKSATQLLLDHAANINARDNLGNTPLHLAALAGRTEEVEFLLSKGANPNLANQEGKTPLDWTKNATGGAWVELTEGLSFIQAQSSVRPGTLLPGFLPTPITASQGLAAQRTSIATALKAHGALEVLPQLDRIQVSRASANYSQPVFTQHHNDWNQMTLLETLAAQYQLLATEPGGESQSRFEREAWARQQSLPFPDLSHVRIRRPEPNLTSWHERDIDLTAPLEEGDCTKDVPLAWGEVVEVPEADHLLNASWPGFSTTEFENLKKCLTREVEVTVKGRTTKLTLSPYISSVNPRTQDVTPVVSISTKAAFWIAPALRASNLLLSSSDLSRIKVTRRDAATGQMRECVLDCSPDKPAPVFWLRNGDLIEVPEKN